MSETRRDNEIPEPNGSTRSAGKTISGQRILLRVVVFSLVFLMLTASVAFFVLFMIYKEVITPGTPGRPVELVVPAGVTGREIAVLLADKGLIEHEAFFRVAMRLDGSGKTVKHGPYKLPRGLSPMQLLSILHKGPNRGYRPSEIPDECKVTVPEGLTIRQMSELFDDPAAFVDAASNPQWTQRLGVDAATPEGFLMPNTYYFDDKPTEREVVARMIDQFTREYENLIDQIDDPHETDKLRLVTIASLVEEEARVDDERARIAAVIYNRLERNMPLQMDCTLQYALGKYGQRILYEDKEVESPYNTYLNPGLPPGPISNPGVASLRAALNPADVDYLYFVSNADGKTHTFSKTNAEHVKAVRRFRREIAEQRRRVEDGATD